MIANNKDTSLLHYGIHYGCKKLWHRAVFVTLYFLVTCDWTHQARVFVPDKPLQPSVMQHASLFSPFVSCEENGVFLNMSLILVTGANVVKLCP